MADDIIPLRYSYALSMVERISELEAEIERLRAEVGRWVADFQDVFVLKCKADDEIERLHTAIDALLTDIDGDHRPEWSSDEAEAAGKEPWCCEWCGVIGGWPCVHRRALDELKAARRG